MNRINVIYRPNPLDVRIIGGTGDEDPLTYGGGVVYEGDHGPKWEFWDETEDEELELEDATYTVYRTDVPDDVVKELDWVDWKGVASSIGSTVAVLKRNGKSKNVMTRVRVLEVVLDYHSPENIDSYPLQLSHAEMLERWPHLRHPLPRHASKSENPTDNSYGAGSFPMPKKLLHVGNFVENLKPSRLVSHKVFMGRRGVPETHMLTTMLDSHFSIMRLDMESLLKLGLERIQSNDPGEISFYFRV